MSDPSIAASDPARSVWVAANAGAGKTYTLANRVARLLLAGTPPERILCLTFTKAAAAEMQDRLFRQLGDWSMLDDAELTAKIAAIGGASDDLPKARRLFAQALETPGGLKVLTIHAFCQAVLARFPIEAGIAPAFDVLDEQSARTLAGEARQTVLERAGSGDEVLTDAVSLLVRETGEASLGALLDAGLGSDRRKLDRFFGSLEEEQAARIRRAHGAPDEPAETVARDFCRALTLEIETLRESAAWLAGGKKTDHEHAAHLMAFAMAGEAGFVHLEDLFLTATGDPRKKLVTQKLAEARADLADYLEKLQQRFCAVHERWRAARAAALADAVLTLLGAVRGAYDAAKRARGMLDYDDLIGATRALLEKRGAAAWVLYKLDRGIDHVLVDEAQDTSPEQWAILRKLTEEFFAGEGVPRNVRTLFAVGDEKQSIFSFQGADPTLFNVNRERFSDLAKQA
ncbi:MAG TPA: UvrD-helicase domain-containing protein, partial [Rhizomicrobium sp.]|nr:UvrD-helicase domain-containing protein [Rhizomicrobium sp.]